MLDPALVRDHLDRLCKSPQFERAVVRQRLLRYVVSELQAGRASGLKESSIALDVFERSSDFDPRSDPVVRVRMREVRAKLDEYYATEGASEPIRISIPLGGYVPRIDAVSVSTPVSAGPSRGFPISFRLGAVAAIAIAALLVGLAIRPGSARPAHLDYRSNPELYAEFQKGEELCDQRTRRGMEEGIAQFEHILDQEPGYTPALAEEAKTLMNLAANEMTPPRTAGPRARAAADRALAMDSELAESHVAAGAVSTYYDWNWDAGEAEYRRAIALSPENPDAHLELAVSLTIRGLVEQAIAEARTACELKPLSFAANRVLAIAYFYSGHHMEAERQFSRTAGLSHSMFQTHILLGFAEHFRLGPRNPALASDIERLAPTVDDTVLRLQSEAIASIMTGDLVTARQRIQALESASPANYVAPYKLANLNFLVGQPDRAFPYVDQALREHDGGLIWAKVETPPGMAHDLRWFKVLRQMGF
jgi:tetratricopeptide (TPR) repeat protein